MTEKRGGHTLKTGKIGRCNVLRQSMLAPGENMSVSLNGTVKLESLRERDSMRIHAHLATFMTPVRWLWSGWPDMIKAGPAGVSRPPTLDVTNLSSLGVGGGTVETALPIQQYWRDAPVRIYNEWYKWPENADISTWVDDGPNAVPLSNSWSRCRYSYGPSDTSDYDVASATAFDVRNLAYQQGRFKAAMDREVLSYNRYMELMKMMYDADGSREVDQVPIMVDQTEVGVNPREIPATDGASLGQWQSIFDFGVNHTIRGVSFPEHVIVTYMLVVRFASITERRAPLANPDLSYESLIQDNEILKVKGQTQAYAKDFFLTSDATSFGYLPAGWMWRDGFDVIGDRIDARDTFPYMTVPTTQEQAKQASRINPAFRSQALGDYVADIYFNEDVYSPIGTALETYYAGSNSHAGGRNRDEYPHSGKML
jgi:hypothetical protein